MRSICVDFESDWTIGVVSRAAQGSLPKSLDLNLSSWFSQMEHPIVELIGPAARAGLELSSHEI